jgi:hypothetical protein
LNLKKGRCWILFLQKSKNQTKKKKENWKKNGVKIKALTGHVV